MSLLELLQKDRRAILQAELAFLIHDADKTMGDFIEKPVNHTCPEHLHGNAPSHETRRKRLEAVLPSPFFKHTPRFSSLRTDAIQYWTDATTYGKVLKDFHQINDGTHKEKKHYKGMLNLHGRVPAKPDDIGTLADPAAFHHADVFYDRMPFLAMIVHGAFGGCDGIDSEMDKNAHEKQVAPFLIDTPFGIKSREWCDVSAELRKALGDVQLDSFDPHPTRGMLRGILSNALGATQYPCNDVTLWAHSRSTAALGRATLCKIIMELSSDKAFSPENRYIMPCRTPGKEENHTDFTFMRVAFDRDFLLSRAQKAGDVIALDTEISRIMEEIARCVEDKYLIGSLTYQDDASLLFLTPRLGAWRVGGVERFPGLHARFEAEARDAVEKMVEKSLSHNNLEHLPFAIDFADSPLDELMDNQDKITDVGMRILARSKRLLESPPACRQSVELLCHLSERIAADANIPQRCEVCGIRPVGQWRKRPGTSEREALCEPCHARRHDDRLAAKRNRRGDHFTSNLAQLLDTKTENRLALVSLSFDLSPLHSGEIFDATRIPPNEENRRKGKKDEKKNPSPARVARCHEEMKAYFDSLLRGEFSKVSPRGVFPISIDPSPVRLECVIPATVAPAAITRLIGHYEERFGKFRHALPLSLGVVFFQHKFPLYAVIETARLMRPSLTRIPAPETYNVLSNSLGNGTATLTLQLQQDGRPPVRWRVPLARSGEHARGDDTFHQFKLANQALKPAGSLAPGDAILARDGRFDFIFLDSAARRLAVTPDGVAMPITGMRPPYALSDWESFIRIQTLFANLPDSQRDAIEAVFHEKRLAWGSEKWKAADPVASRLCESIIMNPNAFGKRKGHAYPRLQGDGTWTEKENRDLLVSAATSGLLLDALDFFHHLAVGK